MQIGERSRKILSRLLEMCYHVPICRSKILNFTCCVNCRVQGFLQQIPVCGGGVWGQ
jgi:hypothetical protein